jgi:Mrp family chromosome partitioning ATPase
VLRYLRDPEFLVVTTPSSLVRHVVERLLAMLSEMKVPVIGVIENMVHPGGGSQAAELAEKYDTALLGSVPFERDIDDLLTAAARGNPLPERLAASIRSISARIASADG